MSLSCDLRLHTSLRNACRLYVRETHWVAGRACAGIAIVDETECCVAAQRGNAVRENGRFTDERRLRRAGTAHAASMTPESEDSDE
jgi:hypothetical protein